MFIKTRGYSSSRSSLRNDAQATKQATARRGGRTIVRFAKDLKAVDVMLARPDHHEVAVLESLEDVWLGVR